MAKEKLVSPREAAQLLGLRLDSVYALVWAGKLAAHKLEGRWRIQAAAVEGRIRTKECKHGATGR